MNGKPKKDEVKDKVEDVLKNFFSTHLSEVAEEAEDPHTIVKHVGQYNLKELAGNTSLMWAQLFTDMHSHVQNLRSRELAMLDDLNTHRKNVDARTLLHVPTHDFAFSRIWTFIDELVASLVAKTGLQQDVVADLLVKVLADTVAPAMKSAAKE